MNAQMFACSLSLSLLLASSLSMAQSAAFFGTGGYASQIRTPEMMHKIDSNDDGMVSKDEWDAHHQKVFAMLDPDKSGTLDRKEFLRSRRSDVVSFGTGGYASTLRTSNMFDQLDADHDGTLSQDEFLAYHAKMFDMMDTDRTRVLDQSKFFGSGGIVPR